jgi:hypothetical protein
LDEVGDTEAFGEEGKTDTPYRWLVTGDQCFVNPIGRMSDSNDPRGFGFARLLPLAPDGVEIALGHQIAASDKFCLEATGPDPAVGSLVVNPKFGRRGPKIEALSFGGRHAKA